MEPLDLSMEPESSAEPSLGIAELMLHVADVFTFSVKDCEQFLLGGVKCQLKGTTATIRMMSILKRNFCPPVPIQAGN